MRIGIFDSGLGGLVVTAAIARALPHHDLVYLGDTARVPYGDRSQEAIFRFTAAAVDELFVNLECGLIIVACNTASSEALRRIQQEYLPAHYPNRRVLGVIIPTAESITGNGPVGVLATRSTVRSQAFPRELEKLHPHLQVIQAAAPLLVPLIENDALKWAEPVVEEYVQPLKEAGITELILGCTHYGLAKALIEQHLPGVLILAQEDIIPDKLVSYLERHPEIANTLTQNGSRQYFVTDVLDHYGTLSATLIGQPISFERIDLPV
ncbi:MAG TPA: glutamate racemase [Verrucomicrobiae bacterium]|nr:glutamate racemase [Verrucomicrobiae bacterium]